MQGWLPCYPMPPKARDLRHPAVVRDGIATGALIVDN